MFKNSPIFTTIEVIINLSIGIDFWFKIYMNGFKNYVCSKQLTNIFDAVIATSWVAIFIIMFLTTSKELIVFEEAIEDIFFIVWCILQYLRIFMLIKHQKDAKDGAGKNYK